MVVRRSSLIPYVAALVLAEVACGTGEVRLKIAAECGAVHALKLNGTQKEITEALGEPLRHSKGVEPQNAAAPFDEILHYGSHGPDDQFLFWDQFDLYLLEDRLVRASAWRTFGDSRNAPSGINPSVVFRLQRDADGVERREVGPLFDDVFGCQSANGRQ